MAVVYKLPSEFVEKHRALLDATDWPRVQRLALKDALPEIPELSGVVLEAISRSDNIVVRSASPRMMVIVRRYSDELREKAERDAVEATPADPASVRIFKTTFARFEIAKRKPKAKRKAPAKRRKKAR